jgi:hypothetical protein
MAGNSANVAEMREAGALMVDAGLAVYEVSGWTTRGRSADLYPWALIAHHTAATTDITEMLCNGRSDLPGPLCNFELQKNGRWGLLASGRANHAGEATITNSESYGIEATGPIPIEGYGPGAFPGNYDSYVTGCACILAAMGATTADLKAHKEIAPSRKIDPSFDMNTFRSGVAAGGSEAQDMTGEEHKWLENIYQGMVVPGTTTVSDSFEKLFNRVKAIESAIQVPGATTPEQGFEILYRRVQKIEDGLDLICDQLGIPFDQVDTSTITG